MTKKLLTLLLFGIFGLILGFILNHFSPEFPVISDSKYYLEIGKSLRDGNGFIEISEKKVITPPVYPLFISLFPLEKEGVVSLIYLAQSVLLGLSAGIIYLLSKEFLKRKYLQWLAVLLTFFWPYSIFYTQLISSEILYVFLLYGSIYSLMLFIKSENKKEKIIYAFLTGLLLGITTLQRAVTLLLPFGLLIFTIFRNYFIKPKVSLKAKNVWLVILIFCVALIPWEIYVYRKFDQILPVSSFATVNQKGNKTFAYLNDRGEGFEKPTWVEAKLRNIYLFWDPGASGYHVDILKEKYPVDILILLYKIVFFSLVALFLAGSLYYIKVEGLWMIFSVILYTWAIHVALFPFPRYTFPIIPLVTILAFAALEAFLTRWQRTVKQFPLQSSTTDFQLK